MFDEKRGNNEGQSDEAVHTVPQVQGFMSAALAKRSLPARFTRKSMGSSVLFTDTVTNKSFTVGLCDSHGASIALNAMFGDN